MLSENIKKLRTASNMTQVDLAAALGVSKQCVSNWENDYIQPSIETLKAIAVFFKVSTDYLLDLDDSEQINVCGLSDGEIAHLRLLVGDLLGEKL